MSPVENLFSEKKEKLSVDRGPMLRSFRLAYDALPGNGRPAAGQSGGRTPIAPPPTPPNFATTFGEMAVHVEVRWHSAARGVRFGCWMEDTVGRGQRSLT